MGEVFNVILNKEEKLGRFPFFLDEASDFKHYINNSALVEVKTSGNKFTRWNGRIEEECIFKRLDKILVNQDS